MVGEEEVKHALAYTVKDKSKAVIGGVKVEVREVREKVVGVAWEGIGRSGLGWEISASS